MLKIRPHSGDLDVNTFITSSDSPSDGDFYIDKLLSRGLSSSINPIIDGEIVEYKPDYPSINVNIFFLKFFSQSEIVEFAKYGGDSFNGHVNRSKVDLGLVDSYNNTVSRVVRQPFEHLQDNTSRQIELKSERGKTILQQLNAKPYVVRNKLGLSNTKRPISSGIPIFYSSFLIPFWKKKALWANNINTLNKSSYLYNSIMLMEVYDGNSLNSKRVLTIPIFVNKRYNTTESLTDTSILKPEFNLTDGTEGFNLFLLKNHQTREFYVRFSFWDALSGVRINLIPSTPNMVKQKWIQNINTFKNESLYLKYVIDDNMFKYNIYGYNTDTNIYDLSHNQIDLYELYFDEFWVNTIVPNSPIINSYTNTSIVPTRSNPFTFNIKNIKGGLTLKQKFNFDKWVIPDIGDEFFREILLNIKKQKPKGFLFINEDYNNERLLSDISNFTFKNITNDTWIIRKVELRDIVVKKDDIINDVVVYESMITGGRPHKFHVGNAISILKHDHDYYRGESSFRYILDTTNCFYDIINSLVKEFLSAYIKKYGSMIIPLVGLIRLLVASNDANDKKMAEIARFFTSLVVLLPSMSVTNITIALVNKFMVEFVKLKNSNNLTAYNNLINFMVKYSKEHNSTNEVIRVFNEEQNKYKPTIPMSWGRGVAFSKYFGVNSLDNKKLQSLNETNLVGKLPSDINMYSNTLTFSVRSGSDFYVRPNETVTANLVFNIGTKILHTFIDTQKVNISGSAIISIINTTTKEEKNIIIPIDMKLIAQ